MYPQCLRTVHIFRVRDLKSQNLGLALIQDILIAEVASILRFLRTYAGRITGGARKGSEDRLIKW